MGIRYSLYIDLIDDNFLEVIKQDLRLVVR